MSKFFTLVFLVVIVSFSNLKAQYTPIPVTGFNKDVVANGTGNNSITTTTQEMDAITPSNFVMCSKEFAAANSLTPANTYGLPNNGLITNSGGTRTYQMADFGGLNALYMFPTDSGKLFLTTPGRYTGISMLVLATENTATMNITFKFTDSTISTFNGQSILVIIP